VLSKYRLGAVLGRGQFGVVRGAEVLATGVDVAVKIIAKDKMDPERLEQEITCHSLSEHRNVLKLIEAIELDDCHAIVLEFAGGGDLFDHIVRHTRFREGEARSLFRQILEGVAHCHSVGVVHRDLKPENILLSEDGTIKLADFGLAAQFREGQPLTDSVGSPNYAAPELLVKNCSYDGRKSDLWACGVILYTLLAGRLPFDVESYPDLFRLIRKGQYKIPGHFSTEAADLIHGMLRVDPEQRLTVEQVLRHAWTLGLPTASVAEAIPSERLPLLVGPVDTASLPLPELAVAEGLTPAAVAGAKEVARPAAAMPQPGVRLSATCSALLLSRESKRPCRNRVRGVPRRRILSALPLRPSPLHLALRGGAPSHQAVVAVGEAAADGS